MSSYIVLYSTRSHNLRIPQYTDKKTQKYCLHLLANLGEMYLYEARHHLDWSGSDWTGSDWAGLGWPGSDAGSTSNPRPFTTAHTTHSPVRRCRCWGSWITSGPERIKIYLCGPPPLHLVYLVLTFVPRSLSIDAAGCGLHRTIVSSFRLAGVYRSYLYKHKKHRT